MQDARGEAVTVSREVHVTFEDMVPAGRCFTATVVAVTEAGVEVAVSIPASAPVTEWRWPIASRMIVAGQDDVWHWPRDCRRT